jgi:phosphoglycerate dehydrogenase-like enzyme
LGNIGREIARRASAFDVRVIGITRTGAPVPGIDIDEVRPVTELLEAARGAEYLVVAVPATSSTRGLIDEKVVRALSPDGVLINVARACVVDIQAVVHALRDGHLRGALLDVHDTEPLPADSPLWTVERLWITPHCAFRYPEETRDLSRLIIDNLIRFESGRELRNLVSRDPLLTGR